MATLYENDPTNSQVDWYRRWAESEGYDLGSRSNEELTSFLGNYYAGEGLSNNEMGTLYGGDFKDAYLDLKNRPTPDREGFLGAVKDTGAALHKGVTGLASTGVGALGLGAGALGMEGVEESLMDTAAGLQQSGGEDGPTIERASDVRWDRPSEVARFMMSAFGEAAPSVAESAGSYFLGGGIGYQLGKRAAQRAIRETITSKIDKTAAEALEDVFGEIVKQKARKAFATGSMAGVGISSIGMGVGEIYTELYEHTKLDPSDSDYIAPTDARRISTGFGMMSGGLDFISAGTLLSKMTGAGQEVAEKYLRRLILGLPEGILLEGGTEAAQEFINVAAEKYATGKEIELSGQELDRMFDAGVLGAVGGAQFTMASAVKGPPRSDSEPDTPQPEDQTVPRQRSLYENLQEETAVAPRYKAGDEVQIAFGDTGVVTRILGDQAEVTTTDGSVKSVRLDRLSAAQEVSAAPTPAPAPGAPLKKTPTVAPEKEFDATPADPKKKGQAREHVTPEVTDQSVTINDVTVDNLTQKQADGVNDLYGALKELAESGGMSRNTATAKKTKGFASNARVDVKRKLMQLDGRGRHYTEANKSILRELGVLDATNEWTLGTKLDDELKVKEDEKVKVARLAKVTQYGFHPGKTVEFKKGGARADIDEVTTEGLVVIEGVSYDPSSLKNVKPRKSTTTPKVTKSAGDIAQEWEGKVGSGNIAEEFTVGGMGHSATPEGLDFEGAGDISAHGMAKSATLGGAIKDLLNLFENGIEQREGGNIDAGDGLYVARLGGPGGSTDQDRTAYRDGPLLLVSKNPGELIKNIEDIKAVLVNPGDISGEADAVPVPRELLDSLKDQLPAGVKVGFMHEAKALLAEPEQTVKSSKEQIDSDPRLLYESTKNEETGVIEYEISDPNFAWSGQKVSIRYKLGNGRDQKAEVGNANDEDTLKKIIRAGMSAKPAAQKTIFEVTIGDEPFDASADNDSVTVAGLRIAYEEEVDLNERLGTIDVPIAKVEFDEDGELDLGVDDESKPIGKKLREDSDARARTRVLVVLRKINETPGGHPLESVRVVKMVYGTHQKKKVLMGYDSTTEGYIRLKGEPGVKATSVTFKDYEIVGKITSTSAISEDIDIYFPDLDAVRADENVAAAEKQAKTNVERDDQDMAEAIQGADPLAEAKSDVDYYTQMVEEEQNHAYRVDELEQKNEDGWVYKDEIQAARERLEKDNKPTSDENLIDEALSFLNTEKETKKRVKEWKKILQEAKRTVEKLQGKKDKVVEETPESIAVRALEKKIEELQKQFGRNEITQKDLTEGITTLNEQHREKSAVAAGRGFGNKKEDAPSDKGDYEQVAGGDVANEDGGGLNVADDADILSAGRGLVTIPQMSEFDLGELALIHQELLLEAIDAHAKDLQDNDGKTSDEYLKAEEDLILAIYFSGAVKKAEQGRGQAKETIEDAGVLVGSKGFNEYRLKVGRLVASLSNVAEKLRTKLGHGDRHLTQALEKLKATQHLSEVRHALFEYVAQASSINNATAVVYAFHTDQAKAPMEGVEGYSLGQIYSILEDEMLGANESIERFRENLWDVYSEVYEQDSVEAEITNDLRMLLNPNYQSPTHGARKLKQYTEGQGSRFDREGLAKLDPNNQRIDNLVGPVTGEVVSDQVLVTDDETAEMSQERARADKSSYTAPVENPLAKHPDLIEAGKAAWRAFAPGDNRPQLSTALRDIANRSHQMEALGNLARLINHKAIEGYTVEFMSWEDFRPYASPSKGVLNKAVALPAEKRIIISEAFYNNPNITAQEALFADIIHEAVHAPTYAALNLGYVFSTGNVDLINRTLRDSQDIDFLNIKGEQLGKIWKNVNDVLLPYLREQGSLDEFYGLTSIDEFFSELASNGKFQQFLRNTKLPVKMAAQLGSQSVFKTAWDYVLNFLAKIGLIQTPSETAFNFAKGQLDELLKVSNQTSELTDQIERSNLRNITSLPSRFDNEDILYDYDALLERLSQEAQPGSDQALIAATAQIARGSVRSSKEGEGREGEGTGGKVRLPSYEEKHDSQIAQAQVAREAFEKYAKENGLYLNYDEYGPKVNEDISGGEHDVFLNESDQRWIKMPAGLAVTNFNMGFISKYLERLLIHNHLFPDTAYRLEGFTTTPSSQVEFDRAAKRGKRGPTSLARVKAGQSYLGSPNAAAQAAAMEDEAFGSYSPDAYMPPAKPPKRTGIENTLLPVVSQADVKGEPVSKEALEEHLKNLGFEYDGWDWFRGSINLSDLHAGNVFVRDGKVFIVDPIIEKEGNQATRLLREIDLDKGSALELIDLIEQLDVIVDQLHGEDAQRWKSERGALYRSALNDAGMRAHHQHAYGRVLGSRFEQPELGPGVSDDSRNAVLQNFASAFDADIGQELYLFLQFKWDESTKDIYSMVKNKVLSRVKNFSAVGGDPFEEWLRKANISAGGSIYVSPADLLPSPTLHEQILQDVTELIDSLPEGLPSDSDIERVRAFLTSRPWSMGMPLKARGSGHEYYSDPSMDQGSAPQSPVLGNQYTDPDSPMPANARPDDNAKVMAQADGAGFNELVEALIKVHREVGEELGLELDEFIARYGKVGSRGVAKVRGTLEKLLGQFDIELDSVRVSDAGLNSRARSWGVRKAVGYLEKTREQARKNQQSSALLLEKSEDSILNVQHTYEDLKAGKKIPNEKLSQRIHDKITNVSFQKLEEYVKALPNAGMSQKDLNGISELTLTEISDIMSTVVEARGNIDSMSKTDMNEWLEKSTDARLAPIQGESLGKKVRRFAVMMAMRESKDVMSLMRLNKDLIGDGESSFLAAARSIAEAKTAEGVDQVRTKFPGSLQTQLKHFAEAKKVEINETANLERKRTEVKVQKLIDEMLKHRSDRLRMALGELQPVSIHNNATLLTMRKVRDKKGNIIKDKSGKFTWERPKDPYVVNITGGKHKDRAGFISANRETLEFFRDEEMRKQYSNEAWYEIMHEQALLAMKDPVMDEHFHAKRAGWMSGLQGLSDRFSELGYEGVKLSQMSTRTIALYKDYAGKSAAFSKQFNASFHRVMDRLEISGNELYAGLFQDIWWWMDNHPEYAGKEEDGFSALWKHIKEHGNVPDRSKMTDEARRAIKDMMNKALAARDWEAEVNRKLGNRIRDEDIKVQSYINGEMVDFYRMPMEMGYATMPRTINDAFLLDTIRVMDDDNNWHGEEVKGLKEQAALIKDSGQMEEIFNSLFSEQVVERFVKPYVNSDVRQSIFNAPEDEQGDSLAMGNSYVADSWAKADGSVIEFANIIFSELSHDQTKEARLKWQNNLLGQFFKRYYQLKSVSARVSDQQTGIHSGESMKNTPQSLDSRQVESRLPKEFFFYNMYDEVSSNIRLALMTATSAFGRNGDDANREYVNAQQNLQVGSKQFNALMQRVVGGKHDKPRRVYTPTHKRRAYKILREEWKASDGPVDPEKKFNDLFSQAVARGELEVTYDHLRKYYGADNVQGPYKDANLVMDILGTASMQVLNNPKSSFWQNLSIFEFPNAFRGLNKMAGKGTAVALGNFVNQTFGGIAEAMGVGLDRTGRYAQNLNNTHFRMDEMDLDFKTFMSQVGNGGDLTGYNPKKMVRWIRNLSTHHKRHNKEGTRAPIDPLSLITGIFPYVNNVVNHSVGVGAIHVYSDLVMQASEVLQERGIGDYVELTAEDLGLGKSTTMEWVMGEKDGFNRANEMLTSAGAPSITRLAYDYLERKKADPSAMPIDRETSLLINVAAMNNISGEGFNSKPAFLYTNDFFKYVSIFLGWPLGKMSRDVRFIFRDKRDSTATAQALLKYIALTSAVYLPVGLSFAMLIDWYDDEVLDKPNNLPPISPWAAIPLIGVPMAARDENFSIYSITSRLAKAGVPFGMGMDVFNQIFSKGDPYGSARELSLDSRVFAWSMFKNIYDAMGNWYHQGEFDWGNVGRPFLYGIGGNSVIQMMDATTHLMEWDTEERRMADYIGLRNHIKKTAFLMGLPLRPPHKGGGLPSPVQINVRQMERAAYANDTEGFLKNYNEAVEAAREYLESQGRTRESPEEYVEEAFKGRQLRIGITARRVADTDWEALLGILDSRDRERIESAVQSHDHYLNLIGGGYGRSTMTPEELRRTNAMLLLP